MKTKKGFTLIELLVVVLIIGILAAIAVPKYQVAVAKSKLSTLKGIVSSIKNAEESYFLANGVYTYNFEDLDITLPGYINTNKDNGWHAFTWGNCGIDITNTTCSIPGLLSFQKYYYHQSKTNTINRTVCLAVVDNSAANKACQAETGKDIPAWTGDFEGYTWNSYRY